MKLLALAFVGLVTLTVASPTEAVVVATSMHKNDGTHLYKCGMGEVVLACFSPNACPVLEKCATKCVQGSEGAGCVTEATTVTIVANLEAHQAVHTADTNDVDDVAKKTYQCSNDHTGVLVCQYGFCSTDHYCNKGTTCRDRCACCKKGSHEVADTNDDKVLPRSTEKPGVCVPGTYSCNYNAKTNTGWIIVCDSKGEWQYSADCGDNQRCMKDPKGVAHCYKLQKARQEPTSTTSSWLEDPTAIPIPDRSLCKAGNFSCTWNSFTKSDWIIVCNSVGDWQWSSDCTPALKCEPGPNAVAHCVAKGEGLNTLST
ncbi:hypothetical protein GMOD_00003250 [Pyrenophora seminiperda CCB06]|uniref:Uncharacterized protein n=1 Tax=Pyrenophora seminiperda CCB06 TaxID=1302712 RepID=A0A3M7MII2_9PLEO|nr:hypothetical protein GMOD_00003250 [Pyrenophora seminiperda CCB06]